MCNTIDVLESHEDRLPFCDIKSISWLQLRLSSHVFAPKIRMLPLFSRQNDIDSHGHTLLILVNQYCTRTHLKFSLITNMVFKSFTIASQQWYLIVSLQFYWFIWVIHTWSIFYDAIGALNFSTTGWSRQFTQWMVFSHKACITCLRMQTGDAP